MPVRSTNGSLPSQSFWGKFKGKTNKEAEFRERQAQMSLSRQRLLTLAYDDRETIRMVCTIFRVAYRLTDVHFSFPILTLYVYVASDRKSILIICRNSRRLPESGQDHHLKLASVYECLSNMHLSMRL